MIPLNDRQTLAQNVREAQKAGARLKPACALAGIDLRTLQRWERGSGLTQGDRRPESPRQPPAHALSEAERARILTVTNEPRFAALPPARIVPALADEGVYLASESTFSRILRAAGQSRHRGRDRTPRPSRPPTTHVATAPRQVWCWDMSYLPAWIAGRWFYLYLILDLFSRKIVGHTVEATDDADHAAHLARRTALAEGIHGRHEKPVLHGDNGATLKATTVLAMLHWLGVKPSYSRPRVSDGRVGDWRGAHTSRGVAVLRQSRCLNPPRVSRFQSPLVEPDVQISRIRLSRISLRPSLSPRRPDSPGACRGRASRRDTRTGTCGTPSCLASLVAGPSTAADGARCISGSPGMRG